MADVLPHFVIDPDLVRLGPWMLVTDHGESPLPGTVSDWDYNTDLSIRRVAEIDLPGALASAGLAEDTPLRWAVSWRTCDTHLASSAAVVSECESMTRLAAHLKGGELGAAIDITTHLVLGRKTPRGPVGVARRAGSVLFSDSCRVNLMGSMAQFPVDVIDFAAAGLDSDASFVVEVPSDLSLPVLGSLQLLVNSRDVELVAAVSNPAGAGASGDLLLSHLEEAVYVTLLERAVDRAEELASDSWDPDSVGSSLRALGDRAVDHEGLMGLLALRGFAPTKFSAVAGGEARRAGAGRQLP